MTTHTFRHSSDMSSAATVPAQATAHGETESVAVDHPRAVKYVSGVVRLALGWVFLWAFLDKTFGLGHETTSKDAWVNGGHPTFGFLKFAAAGPFKGFYNDIAGQTWADWGFMLGLLAIGLALMLGVFMNLAAAGGSVLLVLMWTAVLPPENNPFMDDHLVYAAVLVLLALLGAGRYLGLGAYWERLPFVKKSAILR